MAGWQDGRMAQGRDNRPEGQGTGEGRMAASSFTVVDLLFVPGLVDPQKQQCTIIFMPGGWEAEYTTTVQ